MINLFGWRSPGRQKACFLQLRDGCREGLQNSCACVGSQCIMRTWGKFALQLTARQYGGASVNKTPQWVFLARSQNAAKAVTRPVLTEASRRKHRVGSWYFSKKVVTVEGGYGVLFAIRVQILLSITRVAVQV
jgi:hypothetical protein